jgi:hypothetical protein
MNETDICQYTTWGHALHVVISRISSSFLNNHAGIIRDRVCMRCATAQSTETFRPVLSYQISEYNAFPKYFGMF